MFKRGQDNTELLTKDTIIDDAKILSEQKESRLNKDLSQLKKDLTRIDSNRLEKGAEMKATATTKSNAKDDMKVPVTIVIAKYRSSANALSRQEFRYVGHLCKALGLLSY